MRALLTDRVSPPPMSAMAYEQTEITEIACIAIPTKIL